MPPVYALVDCNNFYASCERVFNPRLNGRPIVVLSNNDGCIIARSNEAKALGIGMGQPFYECASIIRDHAVAVFSANFTLYGDMSARVMQTLASFTPDIEIYSIDEAFLRLGASLENDAVEEARRMRTAVQRHTGIPVSIGLGPTRVLAKIANRIAKRTPDSGGVFDLTPPEIREEQLKQLPVENIWGIGSRLARRLRGSGIYTAAQLRDAPDGWLRRVLSITGLRLAHELRGISCIDPGDLDTPRLSLVCSRSFGHPVTARDELKEALAFFATRAAEKLRLQSSLAGVLLVSIRTHPYHDKQQEYIASAVVRLGEPTDFTPALIEAAQAGLTRIFRPGFSYHKGAVMLFDLIPRSAWNKAPGLFEKPTDRDCRHRQEKLMTALDALNAAFGRSTITFGTAGLAQTWRKRQQYRSPAYTTSWHSLPIAHAL